MRIFDEVDFDLKKHGFVETIDKQNITRSKLDIKKDTANFKKGKYRIVACHDLYMFKSKQKLVKKYLATYLKQILKYLKVDTKKTILICGLGNNDVLADSLGQKTCKKVLATRLFKNTQSNVSVLCPSVQTTTGISTYDIVVGVAKQINAQLIILIDSLLTSNLKRLGHSFQISSVGMMPGGAVANNKEITYQTTQVPCITIGIPFMLDLKSFNITNQSIIVAHKDIKTLIENSSNILADVLNSVLNFDFKNFEIKELLSPI